MPRTTGLALAGPGGMLISAALFGYFGFVGSWAHEYTTDNPPRLLIMVALLKWTMRVGALASIATALLAMARIAVGSLLFSILGLASALVFVMVAIWEWTNSQGYYSGVPAFLLIVFGLWNGYSSIVGIKEFMAWLRDSRREQPE